LYKSLFFLKEVAENHIFVWLDWRDVSGKILQIGEKQKFNQGDIVLCICIVSVAQIHQSIK